MVQFQALTWDSFDTDEHLIRIFGKTIDGRSVCLSTAFQPYFFVKLPEGTTVGAIRASLNKMCPDEVVDVKVDRFQDIWGFQNGHKHLFAQIFCNNLADRRRVSSKIRRAPLKGLNVKVPLYEANVDPVLRLMHRTGIQSTGWIDTSGADCDREFNTHADIDIRCKNWKDLKPLETTDIAPFVVASLDIECHSSTGKFPDPDVPGDACFQIAVTLMRFGSDEVYDKTCLCYKQTDPNLDGCTIKSFDTEREMLMAYTEYLHAHDVDIITGWNIFGFDLNYIMKRAGMTGCPPEFFCMSKIKEHVCNLSEKKLSSSALGDNKLKIVPTPGRFYFDLFHEVKKEYKLDSYKLDNVSKLYLGDQKIDMPPKEMFARFIEGDPVKLREVAEYCIKDTLLPHRLLDKLSTLMNLLEMAKATWVPLNYLVERGQQIKVFSQLTKKARELGYLVPTFDYGYKDQTGYEGATVLEAQSGAYYTPITALDFEGLYPSIMMAHNLCYSTLVLDPKYENIPGVEYERFGRHVFAQGVPSVLPNILAELKQFRKQAKKDMAASTGATKRMFNGKQLAYKISMNSVYGFTGASVGMLPCVAIASTVTMKGRNMIEETKNYVEEHFPGSKVRYGDSVTPDTPLIIRQHGRVRTCRIDSMVDTYVVRDDGKEVALVDAEVWTEKGFTPIEQIVRHKTTKTIHRVLTHTGVVDVTEDHSLLHEDATMVKPTEVSLGTKLLHGTCKDAFGKVVDEVSVEEAKVMGFSFKDRTFVPPEILSGKIEVVQAFLEGYKHGGGKPIFQGKELALGMFILMKRLGQNVNMFDYSNNTFIFNIGETTDHTAIKKLETLGTTDGYVYDLTTESHHFHVGPGELVVHNTDSVMVEFDVGERTGMEAIEYSWQLGEQAAEACNSLFKKPNNLELEKVYCPYFLYSKKRYAAKLWTKNKEGQMNMDYVDVKGLQLVRRDNTPHVREVCKELLDVVLESNDTVAPKALARKRAVELLEGEVPHEKLILSQQLGDSYKSSNLSHVRVRDKMRERQPGSEPQSGDRVPYLLLDTGDHRAKAFEKAEDPKYTAEKGLKVDYVYYFKNKFLNPVCDLLEPLFENTKEEIFGELITKTKPPRKKPERKKKQLMIDDLFKNETPQ
jgi:DNA polymerase elongation subunit (family B)